MKFKQIIIAILALFTAVGCTENFDELEKDPVALSANPAGQLTFTQLCMSGDGFYQWRTNLIYSGGFVQHYAGAWNVTEFGSKFKKDDGYALWRNGYSNELKNVVDILEKTKDDPKAVNMNAVAKIMRVMVAQRITDIYGDIPYSEAGLGFSKGIVTPKYDKQEDIYTSFFKDLDDAYNQLSASGGTIKGDLFYGGEIIKWKRLANTLRLRLGMRISEVKPAEAEKQVKAALQNGVFENNLDNCVMKHLDATFNDDPASIDFRGNGLAYALVGNENGDHFSTLVIDFLKNNGDPRLTMYATPKTTSGLAWGVPPQPGESLYEGVKPGLFQWEVPMGASSTSGIQSYFKQKTTPFLHVSYSETQLLLAEAAFRGWIPGSAADYYKKGVEAGIKQLEMYGATPATQTAINAYLTAKPLVAGKEKEQIATQLWITYIFNSIEAYSNWRRTGFPKLIPITNPDSETGGVTPTRLYYPNDEMQKNETNYLEALSRMGGKNDWLNKVWWDKN